MLTIPGTLLGVLVVLPTMLPLPSKKNRLRPTVFPARLAGLLPKPVLPGTAVPVAPPFMVNRTFETGRLVICPL